MKGCMHLGDGGYNTKRGITKLSLRLADEVMI